jgi:hypothetical protein
LLHGAAHDAQQRDAASSRAARADPHQHEEMTMSTRVSFVDSDLLPAVSGIELPTVEPHTYVLLDDDEKVCRVISEAELEESYVDNHIDTFKLRDVHRLTLAVDKEVVDIVYESGSRAALLLGSISFAPGMRADTYAKKAGVIYPIADDGALLLNATNTPHLVAMRTWYHDEARRVNDQRIEIAETVHYFTQLIGHLGTARGELR